METSKNNSNHNRLQILVRATKEKLHPTRTKTLVLLGNIIKFKRCRSKKLMHHHSRLLSKCSKLQTPTNCLLKIQQVKQILFQKNLINFLQPKLLKKRRKRCKTPQLIATSTESTNMTKKSSKKIKLKKENKAKRSNLRMLSKECSKAESCLLTAN